MFYLGRYLCAVIGKFLTALLHPRYLLHSYEFKIEIISYSLAQGFGSFLKLFCFYFFDAWLHHSLRGWAFHEGHIYDASFHDRTGLIAAR